MRVLVFGASGFIGREVVRLLSKEHDLVTASRKYSTSAKNVQIDLLDKIQIHQLLERIKPEVIINCAGVVDNSEAANLNVKLTKNILEAVVETGLKLKSFIICGSAAEYGEVSADSIPVSESTPLNATSPYALSKKRESALALEFKEKYNLPVIIIRIFNPIGSGMHPRLLIPSIASQVKDIEAGKRDVIEVSRLDSKRDYISVSEVAKAIKLIIEGQPKHNVYNVGSGISTSNEQLINLALKYSSLNLRPRIIETFPQPEPTYAVQADVSRLNEEFGWKPKSIIEETIKKVIHDQR